MDTIPEAKEHTCANVLCADLTDRCQRFSICTSADEAYNIRVHLWTKTNRNMLRNLSLTLSISGRMEGIPILHLENDVYVKRSKTSTSVTGLSVPISREIACLIKLPKAATLG